MTTSTLLLLLLLLLLQQSDTQVLPVAPLTNALTAIYCHNTDEAGTMNIRCGINEKIRMLDAYDVVVQNQSNLPLQCLKQKYFTMVQGDAIDPMDCKVPTSFISACSGRENCTLHMQRLQSEQCQNQFVDYTLAFFECVSDVFIHDVCSSQAITSAWGTLQTPNFPNPYTSSDDCWCKLSTQLQYRLFLSVIVFQLIPYDQKCAGAGLYLQSGEEQRSTQCTSLQQGYNYLSDTNALYINFYSRTSTVRGGFWIVYEASHPNAEVHLHCGPRGKLGVPSQSTSVYPLVPSASYNRGWSQSAFHRSTTQFSDPTMKIHSSSSFTTPRSTLDKNLKLSSPTTISSAFTYPHGRLATFELAYGPRGWFVKRPFSETNVTATKFLQTTTPLPIVKWNSTWLYIRRTRTRIPFTRRTTPISTTRLTSTTLLTTRPSTLSSTSTTRTSVTAQQRLLFTHQPWTYSSSNTTQSSKPATTTTRRPDTPSTTHFRSLVTVKTTLLSPTPWYIPEGPFDRWQRQPTNFKAVSMRILSTTQKSTSSTQPTIKTTTTKKSTPIIHRSNTTRRTTTTQKNEITADWFKWPHVQSTAVLKERPDYYEEDSFVWPDYSTTPQMPTVTIKNSMESIPSLSQIRQKQLQQMNFFPVKPSRTYIDYLSTIHTPPLKRQQTQRIPIGMNDGNIAGIQSNEIITKADNAMVIRPVTKQRSKKHTDESSWLNSTDLTIVAVSILFVVLLVLTNLILFAVRRHRHRQQSRHFLTGSFSSSLNDRRIVLTDHLQNTKSSDSTASLANITNNNNNDILPAVGEIVIWDEKDQGGYMIDNHGEWAKIEGRQWFGSNLLKSCSKTSFTKSFRSRFQFFRQSNKKLNDPQTRAPIPPKTPTFKSPLLMDTSTLSPVPEADDSSSEISSLHPTIRHPLTIQALVHSDQDQSDEYYKRIEINGDDSNYTTMPGNDPIASRSDGKEMNAGGSVIISVPTTYKPEDDLNSMTDAAESIYNQNYSIQSIVHGKNVEMIERSNYLPPNSSRRTTKPSIIVGHCQVDAQPLDPKLFLKSTDKSHLAEHHQFYSCSQSFQLSAHDSGVFDEQTMDNDIGSISDQSVKKSPSTSEPFSFNDSRKSKRRKPKHVSFHN